MQTSLTWRIESAAYRAQHLSIFLNLVLFERAARTIMRQEIPRLPRPVVRFVRGRFLRLLERDLTNVELGYYPRELLFQFPIRDYARAFPALLRDTPGLVRRMRSGNFRDLPKDVDVRRYPPYYRRTFHWQTDGYLSDHSAALYDVGVEILFRGTADIMRRQIIPPITRYLRGMNPADVRLCDIACGTGRTLKQLATAHPQVRYYGVDLSPFYIKSARKLLAGVREMALLVDNAEQLPFVDEYFDVVTSVYLFHELPRNARRRVLREAHRVLRPGGLLVVEDSAQHTESRQLTEVLAAFPEMFHEPFYRGYLDDDLADLAAECGFEVESSEAHLVSKVVVARKPARQ